jgi:hypothetical protein
MNYTYIDKLIQTYIWIFKEYKNMKQSHYRP